MQLGLDRLHRQVGALHEADLDPGTAPCATRDGPRTEVLQHVVGVGQVGLQHDAGLESVELRLVEHRVNAATSAPGRGTPPCRG